MQLYFSHDAILVKLAKIGTTEEGGPPQVVPYFQFFQDAAHRADLAFAMLKVALVADQTNTYVERLHDPDLWYWVETSDSAGPYFAGACFWHDQGG